MKTIFIKDKDVPRNWYLIDATGLPMGRLAAKVASMLRGKNKATYTPHQEMGDNIIIINAEKVAVSGTKESDKIYYHHTGFPGGLKSFTFAKKIERHPEEPLYLAIKGMIPSTRLGKKLLKNVKVYAGSDHPHKAQNPQPLKLEF
ncbi:MAG: 50S ribosomal protein L13 [Spirochaetaceae bacterium]|nr:50S ribosomal protein L13 [Spirochaetaceae bacterium]